MVRALAKGVDDEKGFKDQQLRHNLADKPRLFEILQLEALFRIARK